MGKMTDEEYDMYQKLFNLKGSRIKFDCDGVTYQGIVDENFNKATHQFKLMHAIILDGGDYLGTLRFRYYEVKSLAVVETKEQVMPYGKNEHLINILRNRSPQKVNIAKIVCDLSDDSDDESEDDEPKEEFVLDVPFYLKSKLPSESVILKSIDSHFVEAIRNILQANVIGVSFEGSEVSRFGDISFITIATKRQVYLFDMETLSQAAYKKGLQQVLEDEHLLKVVHDSRFVADCLFIKYKIDLKNVFDTQIADFVAAKQVYVEKNGYKYDCVCNLDGALAHHLDIPPEYIFRRVKGLSDSERDKLFTKRPISNEFRYDLMKKALYLLLLHKHLSKRLLLPLHKYSTAYRNVITIEGTPVVDFLGPDLSSPECMPETLIMKGIQTVKFVMPVKKKPPSLEIKYIHPKTGKIFLIKDDDDKPTETTTPVKKVKKSFDKENQDRSVQNKSELPVGDESTELENCLVTSCSPSRRPMDELYHKLCNNVNSNSINAYNINVKPDYVSKFTMRLPFTGYKNKCNEVSEPKSIISKEMWAKIRAEPEAPRAELPNQGKRKIRFIPA